MDDNSHILSLPKDIQWLIFDMLPLRILARSQQVCKQWNNELLSSLKRLTINDSKINGEIFAKIVSKLSPQTFKHLKLGAEAFIWDLSPLFRITHLSSLDIHSSPSLSSSAFVHAVEHLPNLKNIRIFRSLIAPRDALSAIVEHLPQLAQLRVVYAENDVDIADLNDLTKLTSLSTLILESHKAPLDDHFIRAICSTLTKLDTLHVKYAPVSESLSALSRLKMMTNLSVPAAYFASQSPSVLPSGLQSIEAKFSNESVEALVSQCKGLTSLIIGSPADSDKDPSISKITDEALLSIAQLPKLSLLSLELELSNDTFKLLHPLTSLQHLSLVNQTSAAIDALKGDMPNLQYVNGIFVVRNEDNSDPFIKYENHYQCEHNNTPIKRLASFSDRSIFAAAIGSNIWIQDREDLLICKAKVNQLLIANQSDYILLCDDLGQFGCFSMGDDDFIVYTEPVSRTLNCIAISDNQRFIVAGTNQPEIKLLNTLGTDKFTIRLKYEDNDTPVEGHAQWLYFKSDEVFIIGVMPHGVFTWDYSMDLPVDFSIVQKTPRTITASAYFGETDLLVLGDSDGLVTLSKCESLVHTENFQCDAPVVALSAHRKQPLVAIATEKDIIIWCPVGGSYKVPHSSLPIEPTAKCTAIEWARNGGVLFAGYSNGTVVKFVKCQENECEENGSDPKEKKKSVAERTEECGNIIYYTAEKYLKAKGKEPIMAGKLTGMMLEMDIIDLEDIVKQEARIIAKLEEGLEVLERHYSNFN